MKIAIEQTSVGLAHARPNHICKQSLQTQEFFVSLPKIDSTYLSVQRNDITMCVYVYERDSVKCI